MKILTKRHWKVFFGMICRFLILIIIKMKRSIKFFFFISDTDISSLGRENGVAWH